MAFTKPFWSTSILLVGACERFDTVVIAPRQFCKTLCNVLLTSQFSFKCIVLIHQSTHLLLQSSRCIFHFWTFSSSTTCHESDFRGQGQLVTSTSQPATKGQSATFLSHHQQRLSHLFQRRPETSSTLVPTSFPLVPDSQPTVAIIRGTSDQRAQRAPQQGTEEKDSTALRHHVCRLSAQCPARYFVLDTCDGLCTHG